MSTPLEAVTTATVSLALEAATRRHQALAANIANANTEGYAPMKLSFETQLAEAREALRTHGTVSPAHLQAVRLELEPMLEEDGRVAKPSLDLQVAEMAANAVQYQALAQGLSRHMSIMATAVADGRK
ncbi:flagellar basal body protein [Ramlibacter pallidus]|uniref:Flagellar basal body rod protein FlgB n=1 Tax=Ramlibacter pallidus TaxID=2780087 RepID=A0ABR9S0Z8_9BURK|nr:flagellar basal body protein [Ramlibacter pallidus]MBE7367197.1 flagellar basal body protein [Ramlibacter pallidus]